MVAQGLVVDSRFTSRKKIVAHMQESGMVAEVIEAQSVGDGLNAIGSKPFLTCLVGPSLSESVAVDFVTKARVVSVSKECAFVAVLEEGSKASEALMRAGCDGTLQQPFERKTFTYIVKRAVLNATKLNPHKAQFDNLQLINTLNIASHSLVKAHQQDEATLPAVLHSAANGLRQVARNIALGRLVLKKDGTPTLATRDAVRLALELALPSSDETHIGTPNHFFISALVQYLSNCVHHPQKEASEILRKCLIEYSESIN
jgi:DNA-binding phage protein